MSRQSRAMKSLIGVPMTDTLAQVLGLIPDVTDLTYAHLLWQCERMKDYELVSNIVLALVAAEDGDAPLLLNQLSTPLSSATRQLGADDLPQADYVLGVCLGLFKAAIWVDKNKGVEADFHWYFLDCLVAILLSDHPAVQCIREERTKGAFETAIGEKSKAWIRFAAPTVVELNARSEQCYQLLGRLNRGVNSANSTWGGVPPQITRVVIDQLALGFFMKFTPAGRLQLLAGKRTQLWRDRGYREPRRGLSR